MHIHTELGVTHETFIALIEELHGMGHTDSRFVSVEEQLFVSMPMSQGWLFSTWVRDFKDLMTPFQSIQIIFIGAENYLGILKKWLLYFPHPHFTPIMSSYPLALIPSHLKYPTIQNSGHISKMQLVLLMAATFTVPLHHIEGLFIETAKGLLPRIASLPAPSLSNLSIHWLAGRAPQLMPYYAMMLLKRVFLFLKENIYLEMQDFQPAQSFLHHIKVFNITWQSGGVHI